jgi:pimeloyl-ACP methyl ester carboxylesterase
MAWDWGKAALLLARHDFVLVGYRGVDGSTVLDCPTVTKVLAGDDDPLSEESMRKLASAWIADAERLKGRGVNLDGYTMLECIEDHEAVCRVLGYTRINLLSESYGTRIAYLYGLRHPGRLFRSAMIAVNPPGHFIWDARVTDRQLRRYATLWSQDSSVSAISPDLYGTLRTVLSAMPRRWLVFPINPGKVRIVTFALLFQRSSAAMVFDTFIAAEHGDPSGLALMSLAYDFVVPSLGTWGDLACKAISADFDSTMPYTEDPALTPLGSPMTRVLWGPLSYTRWPMQRLPDDFRKGRQSDVETLLLSGSLDFSTPPEFATAELLPLLTNGRQVILSECGHVNDMWYAQPEHTRRLLTSFYETGVPDTSLNAYLPMNFHVGWGFPAIAKASLAGAVLISLGVVAVIVWLVRRYRRRKTTEVVVAANA